MTKFGIAPGPSRARRKIATAFAAAGALLLSSGMVVMAAAPAAVAATNGEFWVCKWVGKPKLGDAAHHINPAPGNTTGPGEEFSDAQEASLVIGPSLTEPPLSSCGTFGDGPGKLPVAPTEPTLTLSSCVNGVFTPASLSAPEDAGGITYDRDGWTVTASIDAETHEWGQLSADWVEVDEDTATYTVDEVDRADAPCTDLTPVVPTDPTVSESTCLNGVLSKAEVIPATGPAGVTYLVNGSVVTAMIDSDTHEWGDLSSTDWDETGVETATFVVDPADLADAPCGGTGTPNVPVETPDEDTLVTPLAPSATDANCSRDGRLVVPAQPAGVDVEQVGTAPGDVTFTFTPAAGYAFPAGTDSEVTVTVPAQLSGDDCIQGVETSRPKPQPGTNAPGNDGPAAAPVNTGNDAEVLGEQAVAVPTAVAAGIGDTMTTSTTGSPQLAQALVAAGLLMLVAGGATGLGRRTRGAHES